MIDVEYDASNFWGMTQAMGIRDRVRMMKSAMRASAGDIKRRAGEILISELSSVRNPAAMKKTIWTKVYDRTAGFRVSVAGNNHCYPSRMSTRKGTVRELPLGRWLEDGTGMRSTGKGYTRGTLPAIGFLGRADSELQSSVSSRIEDHFIEQQKKIAKKYGCI